MTALDDNANNYDLLKHKFTSKALEDYIGVFDTLGNFIQDKLVSEDMAYNELGYEVEKAWCNESVKKYIKDIRKTDQNETGSNAFYSGFQMLAEKFLTKDKKKCPDFDKK